MKLRSATKADAAGLCAVINPLIAAGGTTAHRNPFDVERMQRHYIAPANAVACILAEDNGEILGFQSLVWGEGYDLPQGWTVIATFVRQGLAQRGVGTRLFGETLKAARASGVVAIDATIRRENTGGLTYYGRMGFEDYRDAAQTISKRYDIETQTG